jgi:hypothetical protein
MTRETIRKEMRNIQEVRRINIKTTRSMVRWFVEMSWIEETISTCMEEETNIRRKIMVIPNHLRK